MRVWACVGLLVLISGCSEDARAGGNPVHFYVSNQSFEQPEADLTLRIDGKVVFDRLAEVEDQHNWIPFDQYLAPGRHTITATEATSSKTQSFSFTVDGEHWAVLDYWTGPPRFTFSFQDEPVVFD